MRREVCPDMGNLIGIGLVDDNRLHGRVSRSGLLRLRSVVRFVRGLRLVYDDVAYRRGEKVRVLTPKLGPPLLW